MTLSFNVTRRKLQLGSRDATTGLYKKNFVESTDADGIEMIVQSRGSTSMPLPSGVYVRLDAVGVTADVFEEGDEVVDNGVYYEIKTVELHYLGDSFWFRECQLARLPLHELV